MLRSILINAQLLMDFKAFCTRKNLKMKPTLEKLIRIYIEG